MKEQKSAVEENNVNLNKSRCGGAALQHLHVQTCRIATRQNRVRQKNATRGDWRNINKKQPGGVGGWWGGGGKGGGKEKEDEKEARVQHRVP